MVSVDGDTSTNDTVLVMANGLAENELISEENDDYNTFKDARNVRPDESGRTFLHSEFDFITDTQLLRDMTRSTRRILCYAFDTK